MSNARCYEETDSTALYVPRRALEWLELMPGFELEVEATAITPPARWGEA